MNTLISLLGVIVSIISIVLTYVQAKKLKIHNEKLKMWDKKFIDETNDLSIIPFLQIDTYDKKIDWKYNKDGELKQLILYIVLINVGKESALEIKSLKLDGLDFKSDIYKDKSEFVYSFYQYFSKRYVLPKGETFFKINVDIPSAIVNANLLVNEKNEFYFSDYVRFKLGFVDMKGNSFEQTFAFDYSGTFKTDNKDDNKKVSFNLRNESDKPVKISSNKTK
ncbi:hypothetical protein C4M96_03380 [Mycoplasmopsis pullorum]|uniref:hypothetical protein n=1 Tax=Mycoplasmopsis pullorum TaxID=48003 RepID=UPI001117B83A|nr:hypothetical protein [Mycoplasmopsis pullorum]TNK82933.1 hypothetical protein C4M93_03270 [Mycoplasmopsis pullorum]TNK91803.1 hypothetical protein C4M96_03380 [Mycoplasmopsis pullorum]